VAQAHQRLGIDATVIDEAPLLPEEDGELVELLRARLTREGVRIRTGVKLERITRRRGGVRVALREPDDSSEAIAIDGSHLFLATARRPAIDGLGLDAGGIAHDQHGIATNRFRTSNRRVYAVGDAITGLGTVVRAEREGRQVVRAILFRRTLPANAPDAPWSTLTDPGYTRVGATETMAKRQHRDVRVWRYPFAETARAVAEKAPEGLLKVVATTGGRILGAAALGRDAAEHVALWSLAISRGLSLAAMTEFAAAYPSRAEAARSLALMATAPGLTSPWRKRIITLLGKFG
jgi:pyruvate/2-oxoglutarate dehydrogenase complex dihydrolipoamide dehydrogenase (E3) component